MNWMSPWTGLGIFLYVAVATLFWTGVKYWEVRHTRTYGLIKWWFILVWPSVPIVIILGDWWERWEIRKAKRLLRKIGIVPNKDVDKIIDEVHERMKQQQGK